jgi:hypothetical protein
MRDARTVIANAAYKFLLDDTKPTGDVSDAILAALADAWLVVVPREPTPELCFKMLAALPSDWDGFMAEDIKELWRAMVGAANEQ